MPIATSSPPAIAANQHIYDDYFREEFTQTLDENILQLLDRVWFRSELVGFEDFPQRNNPDRPLIFASNHSGMAFPWDAIVASRTCGGTCRPAACCAICRARFRPRCSPKRP